MTRHAIALTDESCGAGVEGRVIPVDIAAAKAVAIARAVCEDRACSADRGDRPCPGRAMSVAAIDLPPFDNSAMDGYAVRIADFAGAGPWQLIGCAAGSRQATSDAAIGGRPKEALRIFTGAPVPDGFDAVVMQEHCERVGDRIAVSRRPATGRKHPARRRGCPRRKPPHGRGRPAVAAAAGASGGPRASPRSRCCGRSASA